MDELRITLPDVVFDDSLWILGTERHVKLMEFKNKAAVQDMYDYLSIVQSLADSAAADSLQTTSLIQNIPVKYQRWYFGRFYQPNMSFLLSTRKKEMVAAAPQ
jgi:hypothetical protein